MDGSRHPERQYHGEDSGDRVAQFLNTFGIPVRYHAQLSPKLLAKYEEGRKRVLSIMEMLQTIFTAGPRPSRAALLADLRLNKLLPRYKSYSLVFHERGVPGFIPVVHPGSRMTAEECHTVGALIKLAEMGAINRVKKCQQCENWFYARFAHQGFCTDKCRIKNNATSEHWKEYKRNKAREYYHLHKTGKVR